MTLNQRFSIVALLLLGLTALNAWKRKSLPVFARSVVRFFTLAPSGEIKELAFNR